MSNNNNPSKRLFWGKKIDLFVVFVDQEAKHFTTGKLLRLIYTEIGENLHFFIKQSAHDVFNEKFFRMGNPQNPYALTVQNMYVY